MPSCSFNYMKKLSKFLVASQFLCCYPTACANELDLRGNDMVNFNENGNEDKEKNKIDELKEKFCYSAKNVYIKLNDDEFSCCQKFSEEYKEFLRKSKTERECVDYFVSEAKIKGFQEFDSEKAYNPGDKVFKINRDKSVAFAVIGKDGSKNGFNIVASHIDSPRLDLKPHSIYEDSEQSLMKTNYYGGIKKYQWTAIPLSLHGVIMKQDGSKVTVSIGDNDDEPCFYISDLLPHLAHDQMSQTMRKAISGESLNVLIGSLPFKSDKGSDLVKLNILNLLNEKYGITEKDLLFAELELVPAINPRDIGFDRSLVGAYGQDDRSCTFAAFKGIMDIDIPDSTSVVVLADKEEIGSDGNTGMQSMFFRYFLADLAAQDGMKTRHVLAKSKALSADVDAAFDPNYASSFDSSNSSFLNRGVVITKYTGSGGKYCASDASAEFLNYIRRIFDKSNVNYQFGLLGKVDEGGGGTVAKYFANLGIDVVDVGIPILSMHSPFEVSSKIDLYEMYKASKSFLK